MTNLWIVAQHLGAPSEVWLLRQIERFSNFKITEITWSDVRKSGSTHQVIQMDAPAPGLGELGQSRWLHRIKKLPSGNFFGAFAHEKQRFLDLAKGHGKPDVILAHFGHAALRFLPIAQQLSCPLVAHFHGTDISYSVANNRWYRYSLRKALPKFAACVCVGTAQAERLRALGADPDKIHVIPCGVPTAEFRRNSESSDRTTQVKFATLSRLVQQKGIDICLQALADVPTGELIIMGDGPEKAALRSLAQELGVTDRVTFMGAVSPAIAKETLESCDVFLQHSLELFGAVEGFGVSVSEAASMELPVIVSATGGLIDQVINGKTGFVVPMRNQTMMTEKMIQLASDPNIRKKMGSAGRVNVVNNYDTDSQVAKLEAVLRSTFEM